MTFNATPDQTGNLLKDLSEAVSSVVGEQFFRHLTKFLADYLSASCTLVGELIDADGPAVQTLALCLDGQLATNVTYPLAGTPCEHVLQESARAYPSGIQQCFPDDEMLGELGVEGYVGAPLIDSNGRKLGLLAVLTRDPIEDPETLTCIVRLLAARAASELERLRSGAALLDSQQRLKDFAESASDWFWEMDADLRFCYFSERFTEITGVGPEVLLGKTREETGIPGLDRETWQKHLGDLKGYQPFHNFIHPRRKENGETVWLSISGKPYFNEAGEFKGYRGLGKDITKLKQAEDELLEAKTRAEVANVAKSDFLATMSHEIRTPMTAVLGMSKLLLGSDLDEAQRFKVTTIIDSGEALLRILNDILDLSRLEAGKLNIEPVETDLPELLSGVTDLLAGKAEEKGLILTCECSDRLPDRIHADGSRLRQVLTNLVSNAVKFTEHGEVRLAATYLAGNAGSGRLNIEVTDTGIGIDRQQIDRLFGKFEQADVSTTRRYGGSGLGLAICKQIVELMGGEIGAGTEQDGGSRFWITLPVSEVATPAAKSARRHQVENYAAGRPLEFLIAEDNQLNQLIYTATLDPLGHRLTFVENGEQAVAAAEQDRFDVILMDVRMPVMAGPEAARHIRASSGKCVEVPIIAVTADVMSEERKECLRSGMDDVVTKPIDLPQLLTAIDKALGEAIHTPQYAAPDKARA